MSCAKSERQTPPSKLETSSSGGTTTTVTSTSVTTSTATSSGGAGGSSDGTTTSVAGGATSTSNDSGASDGGGSGGAPVIEDPCGGDAGASGAGGEPVSGSELFFEDFESGGERWESSDGSSWSVVTDDESGSSVYGNGETVNQPQAAFVIDACYTDIIVEARVKVLDFPGSSTTYVAGPCLRVQTEDDYYIVGIQGNGNAGLVRVDNGSRSSLQSEGSVELSDNTWYTLRIEAIGQELRGYVDGELLLEDTDATHSFGSVGVCTSNADALFDDVRVILP